MINIATFYKFCPLTDLINLQSSMKQFLNNLEIKGTVIIAEEGFNSTLTCHVEENLEIAKKYFINLANSDNLQWKYSYSKGEPFEKLKVRRKSEIVSMKIKLNNSPGEYISPNNWDDFITRNDVVLVDTRNDYEYKIGSFKNAIKPDIEYFRDFPNWLLKNQEIFKNKKIAMFCTGGIRCEKATAYMKDIGFNDVYHLEGGILNYFQNTTANQWDGDCFVFDDRVAVDKKISSAQSDQ